jgi:hypothetical protein
MQGAFDSIDQERIGQYLEAVPPEWRQESGNTAERIGDYLELATKNSKALFRKISEVLA